MTPPLLPYLESSSLSSPQAAQADFASPFAAGATQIHAPMILARLLLVPSHAPADHAVIARLYEAAQIWMHANRLSGHLESDSEGCWLYAQISEGDLCSLQNDIHYSLQMDLFVSYIHQHQQHPPANGQECLHKQLDGYIPAHPSNTDPVTGSQTLSHIHTQDHSSIRLRDDLHRCATSAALAIKTYPVNCENAQRSEALRVFRSCVSSKAVRFDMQPILHLQSMAISGHEMLARVPGYPTSQWIAHVVSSHDSVTLANLALTRARSRLDDSSSSDTYISVNMTAGNFLHHELLQSIEKISEDKRKRLVLELTEWQNPSESCLLPKVLRKLRALGVRIAIDDFGAGYSSTVVLREIEFDIIKLDMSLVKSTRRSDHSLMAWAMDCADEMRATVVAEGIETKDDLDRITQMGIAYGQGWHLNKAILNGASHSKLPIN